MSGKLFVSLTRVPDGKNVVMSEFSNKEEVIQVRIFNLLSIIKYYFFFYFQSLYNYIDETDFIYSVV